MQGGVGRQGQPGGAPEVGPAGGGGEPVHDGREGGVVLPEVEPVELVGREEAAVLDAEEQPQLVHGPPDQRGGVGGERHRDPQVGVGGPQLEAQARRIEAQEGLSARAGLGQDAQPPGRDRVLPRLPFTGCLDRKPPSG